MFNNLFSASVTIMKQTELHDLSKPLTVATVRIKPFYYRV